MRSESLEGFVNVAGHRETDAAGTKGYVHPQVSFTSFLNGEFVIVSPERGDQVVGVGLLAVSNTEVVNNQAEGNIQGLVLE